MSRVRPPTRFKNGSSERAISGVNSALRRRCHARTLASMPTDRCCANLVPHLVARGSWMRTLWSDRGSIERLQRDHSVEQHPNGGLSRWSRDAEDPVGRIDPARIGGASSNTSCDRRRDRLYAETTRQARMNARRWDTKKFGRPKRILVSLTRDVDTAGTKSSGTLPPRFRSHARRYASRAQGQVELSWLPTARRGRHGQDSRRLHPSKEYEVGGDPQLHDSSADDGHESEQEGVHVECR